MPSGVYKRTKPAWNKGLTKDTDDRVKKQITHMKQTVKDKYGVNNISQTQDVKDKISKSHSSDEWKSLVKQTKLDKYGDENYNNMEKNKETKLTRYGNPYYNNMEKNYQTRKINKTFNISKPEESVYQELLKFYLKEDIVRQYRDSRYPFNCDFYIISEDLFIEVNYYQGHGPHPFNPNNKEDIDLVNEWRSKQNQIGKKNQYWYYEEIFTIKDPLKLKTAIDNKLNYLVIYRNGLEIKI